MESVPIHRLINLYMSVALEKWCPYIILWLQH